MTAPTGVTLTVDSTDEVRRALIGMRKRAGLNQRDLAALLHCSQKHVSGLESGHVKLTCDWLFAYARAVGVRAEVVLRSA